MCMSGSRIACIPSTSRPPLVDRDPQPVRRRLSCRPPPEAVMLDALRLALAVYPEARVDVCEEGLVLHPSPLAVPKAEARWIGIA